MAPRHGILVTGSRSLAVSGDMEAWATGIILKSIVFAQAWADAVIITGDARGPDEWAIREAERLGIEWHKFTLHQGQIWHSNRLPTPWDADHEPNRSRWGRMYPLFRNEVMVSTFQRGDWDAMEAIALIDPNSATRGTDHTVRLLRERKIPVACHRYSGAPLPKAVGR
jgi:hypothetical protein